MSYILDALKKSEKERTLGNIPTLESGSQTDGKRVPVSWFIGLLAVLLTVSVAFGVWSMWRNDAPVTAKVAPVAQRTEVGETTPDASMQSENVESDVPAGQISVTSVVEEPVQNTVAIVEPTLPDRPVSIAELDQSVRSRLPDLSVNVLSYSENKSRRFVMINQNIYKEGQDIGGGITIEEIENSRAVLSFAGVRFFLLP